METKESSPEKKSPSVNAIGFVVNERAVAIYGFGMREMTENFIKEIGPEFWDHQLTLLLTVPRESVNDEHVTLARFALSHAQEHLFSLIFAYLQAPHCPDLWLYHYKHEDLIDLVRKVENSEKILTGFNVNPPSWEKIVRALWGGIGEDRYLETSSLLANLAKRFTSKFGRDEFNGLKHGMRLSIGGNHISFSPGGRPDKPPALDSFIPLGGSAHGSRFWAFDKVQGTKNHYRARLRMTNWDYDEQLHYLARIILLISNLGVTLRVFANIEGDRTFRFVRGEGAYDNDRKKGNGIIEGELTANFTLVESDLLDLDQVKSKYT